MNSMHTELLAHIEHHYRTQILYPAAERQAAYQRILAQPQPAGRHSRTLRWRVVQAGLRGAALGRRVLRHRPV
jgi:hypothetical protein